MTLRLVKVSLGRFSNGELGTMSSNEVHGVVRSGDSAGNTNEVCNESDYSSTNWADFKGIK